MIKMKQVNEEVFFANSNIAMVRSKDIEFLKERAILNKRKRARLCVHRDNKDSVHEMLIVLLKGVYIPPHRHHNKKESFHIIEGSHKVVIFNESGDITKAIIMGDYTSGNIFYYRLSESCFHTVIPISDIVVFHETTDGPFRSNNTINAPWAPEDNEYEMHARYLRSICDHLSVR